MSTDLTTFQPDEQSIAHYLGLDPRNPATHAVVAVCQRYDLDPVLKHVIVIPKGGVYLTRDGLLHIAHRSGQLDGIVVDQEPTLTDGEWTARVSVYRKDMRHPFTFPGRYPVNGGNRQYAQEMALKAAEAHALRRAFDVNGIPTLDEQRPEDRREPASRATLRDRLGTATPEPTSEPVEAAVVEPDAPEPLTDRTRGHLFALLHEQGIEDREQQIAGIVAVIGRPIASRSELTEDEARAVIIALEARAAADAGQGQP